MKFKEFKKITQTKDHPINFYRNISILISYLLSKTPITPAYITGGWVFLGIIGGILLWILPFPQLLIATTLILLVPILDFVDGEIARYRNYIKPNSIPSSPKWSFWDWTGFWIIKYITMCGITYRIFLETQNITSLIMGFLMISGYSIIEHIRMYEQLNAYRRPTKIHSSKKNPQVYSLYQDIRKILLFEYFHLFLFLTSLFNKIEISLFFYGTVYTLHWISKVVYENIRGFKD